MRDLAECCVSCGLLIEICEKLNNDKKCIKCSEIHEADNQDDLELDEIMRSIEQGEGYVYWQTSTKIHT